MSTSKTLLRRLLLSNPKPHSNRQSNFICMVLAYKAEILTIMVSQVISAVISAVITIRLAGLTTCLSSEHFENTESYAQAEEIFLRKTLYWLVILVSLLNKVQLLPFPASTCISVTINSQSQ